MTWDQIVLLIGGPGGILAIWKWLEANAENKVLAKQAEKTVDAKNAELAAKNTEIAETKAENQRLWQRNERLHEQNAELWERLKRAEERS